VLNAAEPGLSMKRPSPLIEKRVTAINKGYLKPAWHSTRPRTAGYFHL
jgi:hypothetical protein